MTQKGLVVSTVRRFVEDWNTAHSIELERKTRESEALRFEGSGRSVLDDARGGNRCEIFVEIHSCSSNDPTGSFPKDSKRGDSRASRFQSQAAGGLQAVFRRRFFLTTTL